MEKYPKLSVLVLIVVLGGILGGVGVIAELLFVGAWAYGGLRSWQARPMLGIIAFIVFPIAVTIGALSFFKERNVAVDLIDKLTGR
jgi:hypothetical protein